VLRVPFEMAARKTGLPMSRVNQNAKLLFESYIYCEFDQAYLNCLKRPMDFARASVILQRHARGWIVRRKLRRSRAVWKDLILRDWRWINAEKFLLSIYYTEENSLSICKCELFSTTRLDTLTYVLKNLSIQGLLRDYLFKEVVNKFRIETYKGYRRLRLGLSKPVAVAPIAEKVVQETRSV
jgi:hypothetical protein